MRLAHIIMGGVLAALGVFIVWAGANLSVDFADMGSIPAQYDDGGSVPAFLLLPTGLVVFLLGLVLIPLAFAPRHLRQPADPSGAARTEASGERSEPGAHPAE